MNPNKSNWFVSFQSNHQAKLRLICLPYAGGNVSIFKDWHLSLPDDVEIVGIQAPGRSTRIFEPVITNMNSMIEHLLPVIPCLLDKPYVLFGHSLGSRVAFELMQTLERSKLPLPEHFVASASRAPHSESQLKITYNLPDEEFIQELKKMNGTSEELLNNKELMQLLLPMLRADFQIAETYQAQDFTCLNIPLTIFGGKEDHRLDYEQLQAWQQCFSNTSTITMFEGGHFFLETHPSNVLQELESILTKTLMRLKSEPSI